MSKNEVATRKTFIERASQMTVKASITESKKSVSNIAHEGAKLSVLIANLIDRHGIKKKDIAEELSLSGASITKFYSAGLFYMSHPDMFGVEYTKAYLLSKCEKEKGEMPPEPDKMSQRAIEKWIEESEQNESTEDSDIYDVEYRSVSILDDFIEQVTNLHEVYVIGEIDKKEFSERVRAATKEFIDRM